MTELIPLSFYKLGLVAKESLTPIRAAEIIQPSLRTVRRRLPVVSAAESRARFLAFLCRFLVRNDTGPAIRPDAIRPTYFGVGFGKQKLAVRPVQGIEMAVAVGVNQSLDRLTAGLNVD